MKTFTILHTETLKKWGGQQNRVLTESAGLSKRGHKIIIACHRDSILAHKAKEAGIKVYEVNMVKQAYLQTISKLIRVIKKEKVDIVCTHSSVDSWAGGLAAKLTGRKLVRFRHNLYQLGKDPLTKFIYHIPGAIVCISDEIKKVLLKCGIEDKKMVVIHSSVDIDKFDPQVIKELSKKELNISDDAHIIGNTSSFTGVKGQEYLLEAFNIICKKRPCYLIFAGRLSQHYKAKYLEFVEKEFRNNVIFLGHRDDIPEILKTFDIFVFPSFVEGLGTSLIEAMAVEKPVVVSDIPTFRNFVVDGVNGLFFKAKNPEDMAEKVLFLMENENLKGRLGKNARATVLEKFSRNKMLNLTEALYKEVIKEGRV